MNKKYIYNKHMIILTICMHDITQNMQEQDEHDIKSGLDA